LLLLVACSQPAPIAAPAPEPVRSSAQPPLPVPGFCANAKPILIGKKDHFSAETASDILAHNQMGAKLCGWKHK
jgi:hypothetical protein